MDVKLHIVGDRVACHCAGTEVVSVTVEDFLSALQANADQLLLPEAIPEGVRFVRRRGSTMVLVVEEPPQTRTVRWLDEGSAAHKGPGAVYRTVRLSFPFVVLVLAFRNGAPTGFQQCFYRTAPLRHLEDTLLFCNLYNVRPTGSQQSWLCLKSLKTVPGPSPWSERLREIRDHLWSATFNRSVEMDGGQSYWTSMRHVDPRVETVDQWAAATDEDPLFSLTVDWPSTSRSVADLIAQGMRETSSSPPPRSASDLAALMVALPRLPSRPRGRPRQGVRKVQ